MKVVPAGVSKKTGRPYNSFLACPEQGCKWKPEPTYQPVQQGGWQAVRQQVAQKVAPEKAVMTKSDWEARDRQKREWELQKDRNILLQVAFKAAVELYCAGKLEQQGVTEATLFYHNWLLSQTEGQSKPSGANLSSSEDIDPDLPPIEAYENDIQAIV